MVVISSAVMALIKTIVHVCHTTPGCIASVCHPRIKKIPATKAGTVFVAGRDMPVSYIFGKRARNAASSSSVGI